MVRVGREGRRQILRRIKICSYITFIFINIHIFVVIFVLLALNNINIEHIIVIIFTRLNFEKFIIYHPIFTKII